VDHGPSAPLDGALTAQHGIGAGLLAAALRVLVFFDGWLSDGTQNSDDVGGVPVIDMRYRRPL
jgi:hypothetical protein